MDTAKSVCINSKSTEIIKPIIICAPYWFRFMQCINRYYVTGKRLSNGFNALKYGLSLSVTLLGAFHKSYKAANIDFDADEFQDPGRIIWLFITLISTFYLIFWDIKMDWNISCFSFKNRAKSYPVYWYYIAIINDVILRFFWTFTLFPSDANPYFNEGAIKINYFLSFVFIAEVFRRCVWSLFRVEKAHIAQKDEFRKYEYIPLYFENNTLQNSSKDGNKKIKMIRNQQRCLWKLLLYLYY